MEISELIANLRSLRNDPEKRVKATALVHELEHFSLGTPVVNTTGKPVNDANSVVKIIGMKNDELVVQVN